VTPRPHALRIGLFALLGLALLAAAIVAVLGVQVFKAGDRVVMNFAGSVYGLQVGAPVVFRGVRLGGVRSIGVAQVDGRFAVPVVAELDRAQLQKLAGVTAGEPGGATAGKTALAALLQQGLSAQLATQSLLTGQLYVDLDLREAARMAQLGRVAAVRDDGLVEIPTSLTRFQSLQEQLDRVDVDRMSQDLAATLAAAKGLLAGPEMKQVMTELAQASAALSRVATSLDQRLPALADTARGTLQRAGDASARVGTAADRLGERVTGAADRLGLASDRVGAAAGRAETLLAPGSPLHSSVQGAADELARAATALRAATGDDSASLQSVQRAMADVSRAARAVRTLADQIEQQPQSLIRGREATP
jgi:paraquat-inducible protein B